MQNKKLDFISKIMIQGLLVTFIFMLPDIIFKLFQSSPIKFSGGMVTQIFLFAILSSSTHSKKFRYFLWSFWGIFMTMELCHFAFFGSLSTPYTYIWMMSELKDTFDGALHSIHLFYAPLSVIIPFVLLFWIDKKFDKNIKRSKISTIILSIALFYMAIDVNRQNRAFFYASERESNPTFIATTRKTNFIIFKAIPKLLFRGYNTNFKPYEITKITSPEKINIIYIFGESGNPNFFSIDSATKQTRQDKTTPHLDNLKNDATFWYSRGFSSSVSTIYSVMMNFYMQREPENHDVQINKKSDILQLVKNAGFKSWFIEAQNTSPDYKDKIDFVYLIENEVNKNGEEIALNYFPKLTELSNKNFILYHQNIMHFDYKTHYEKFGDKWKKFKPSDNSLAEEKISEYKNSVFYWDYIIGKIFNYAKNIAEKTNAPTYVIYMSDHGELIGENKRGHSILSKEVATIPMFVKCFNCSNVNEFKIKNPTHYRMNEKLLHIIGYHLHNPNDDGKTFYINGKSLYGDDGFITMTD